MIAAASCQRIVGVVSGIMHWGLDWTCIGHMETKMIVFILTRPMVKIWNVHICNAMPNTVYRLIKWMIKKITSCTSTSDNFISALQFLQSLCCSSSDAGPNLEAAQNSSRSLLSPLTANWVRVLGKPLFLHVQLLGAQHSIQVVLAGAVFSLVRQSLALHLTFPNPFPPWFINRSLI